MKSIIIIGAGPAGMFAAIQAANENNKVIILDGNERLGKKLAITGKGRCNLTNDKDISEFFQEINSNRDFMYSPFYSFTNEDLMNFFSRKVPLKVERGGRVFPESDSSFDFIDVLRDQMNFKGVEVHLNTKVQKIIRKANSFHISTNKGNFIGDYLLIASGGASYARTGSDGSVFPLIEKLGHNVTPLRPSLVPLASKEPIIEKLRGISLRNIELSLYKDNKKLASEFGEMLFSHYGLSGPVVLTLSNQVKDGDYWVSLDLKPALDFKTLDERLIRDLAADSNRMVRNGLKDLTVAALLPILLEESGIDGEKPCHQVTREERHKLVSSLKGLKIRIDGTMPLEQAIITQGGVDVLEIDPSSMESKLIPKLYFAGEVIDVDANTGGYNLQIAFSTGFLAGMTLNEVTK